MMSPNDDASSVPSSASAPATAAAAASGPPLAHHLQQPAANPLAPATPATQTTTTSSSPGAADRIRRNTACTNCRDAKVSLTTFVGCRFLGNLSAADERERSGDQ